MRIPRSKVWRAFPELDRFSDEACRRFVRSPSVGGVRRWLRVVCSGSAAAAGIWLSSALVPSASRAFDDRWLIRGTLPSTVSEFVSLITIAFISTALASIGPIAGLFVRDRMLKAAIRRMLAAQGTCDRCGYSLLGLRVDAESRAECPECGLVTRVDESISELAVSESGQRVLRSGGVVSSRPFWTPRRRVLARRCAVVVAVPLVVLLAAVVVWDMINAHAVRRMMPTTQEWIGDGRNTARDGRVDESNARFEILAEAARLEETVRQRVNDNLPPEYDTRQLYTWLYVPTPRERSLHYEFYPRSDEDDEPKARTVRRQVSRTLIAAQAASGLFSLLDQVSRVPPAERTELSGPVRDRFQLSPGERWIGLVGVMDSAAMSEIEAGEWSNAVRSIRTGLNLRMLARCQRNGTLVAWSYSSVALLDVIASSVGPSWSTEALAQLDEVLADAMTWRPDIEHVVEIGWLELREEVSGRLSNYSRIDALRNSRWRTQSHIFGSSTTRCERGAFDLTFVPAISRGFDEDRYAHLNAGQVIPVSQWPVLRPFSMSSWHTSMDASERYREVVGRDRLEILLLRGCRLLIAIEVYRRKFGHLPETLEKLSLPDLALDPWTGQSLRYVQIDPRVDRFGRTFLLYSIGGNEVDDLGVDDAGSSADYLRHWKQIPIRPPLPVGDIVINRTIWPEPARRPSATEPTPPPPGS
jgi:hypothetical protein